MIVLLALAPAMPAVRPAAAQTAAATEAPRSPRSDAERVERLEREIRDLKAEVARLAVAGGGAAPESGQLAELERRIEVLAAEIERLSIGEAAAAADRSDYGFGPAASKIYRTERGLSVGGYGELVYQRFADDRDDGASAGRTDTLDLLRGVLYFGYKWNDRWLLNTEVEYEHAGEEVSLEFAYVDYLWRPQANLRAGLLLMPMGFINELHEPTVFLGALRPQIERSIIPTTWRENGFGLFGEAGPLSYRTYIVNGLRADGFTAAGLRGGRQSGGEAQAEDFAWVGRLDYTGAPGLLVGGSAYLGDSGQALADPAGRSIGVETRITEAHLDWRWRGLEVRALGVEARLDDVARLNAALGLTGNRSVGERLSGYYLQAGYDVLAGRAGERALIPYARWETYDTQDEVPSGFLANPANDVDVLTLGLAWKPLEQLILKVDHQNFDNAAGSGVDQLNVALGYVF